MNRLVSSAAAAFFLAVPCFGARAADPGFPGFNHEFGLTVDQASGGVIVDIGRAGQIGVVLFEGDLLRVYHRSDGGDYASNQSIPINSTWQRRIVGEDLNGDGLDDLILLNGFPVTALFVLLQTENGTFLHAPQSPMATPIETEGFAAGDFDGDGIVDLATASDAGPVLYRGLGAGRYAFPQPITADFPLSGTGLATGKEDNGPDQLVIYSQSTPNTPAVVISMQGPGGQFTVQQSVPAGNGIRLLDFRDFEGDGDKDMLIMQASQIRLAENTTSGFVLRSPVSIPSTSGEITGYFDDLDADGVLDAVLSRSDGPAVMFGDIDDPASRFTSPKRLGSTRADISPARDLTGDGLKDIFVSTVSSFHLYRNDGARFEKTTYRHATGFVLIRDTFLAPWSAEGPPVLLINDEQLTKLRSVTFTPEGDGVVGTDAIDPLLEARGDSYLFADLNGDGLEDFVWNTPATGNGTASVSYRLATGPGAFFTKLSVPSTLYRVRAWQKLDINADGADDLVLAGELPNQFEVMLGMPGAGLGPANAIPMPEVVQSLGCGDFDGDGFDDIAVFVGTDVLRLHGRAIGVPVETARSRVPASGWPHTLDRIIGTGDMNGDGLDDLVFFGTSTPTSSTQIQIVHALPGRGFSPVSRPAGAYGNPEAVRVIDLNGDGRMEVIAVDENFIEVIGTGRDGLPRVVDRLLARTDDILPTFADINLDGVLDVVESTRTRVIVHFATTGAPCPGDLDPNGRMDWFDIATWIQHLHDRNLRGDLDGNGLINYFDLVMVLNSFATGCPDL